MAGEKREETIQCGCYFVRLRDKSSYMIDLYETVENNEFSQEERSSKRRGTKKHEKGMGGGGNRKVCPPPQGLMVVLESGERREISRVWIIFLFAKLFLNFCSCTSFLVLPKFSNNFFITDFSQNSI